jgi:ribosomal protein L21
MASKRQSSFNKAVNYIRKKHPDIGRSSQQSEFNKALQQVQKDIAAAKSNKKIQTKQSKPKKRNRRERLHRQSILSANSKSISQPRLNQAGVPNAPSQFPPQFHLETGNFKFGRGFKERSFYEGAKLNSQTQATAAKNVLKRAKKIKKVSIGTVATVTLGSIVAAGVNNKLKERKIPEGYKMVFGKVRKVRG